MTFIVCLRAVMLCTGTWWGKSLSRIEKRIQSEKTLYILLTKRRLNLKLLKKNPFEPHSLINYRKSTDDCCFLLAKSDFCVPLIPCHNLHPAGFSLSLSLSLSLLHTHTQALLSLTLSIVPSILSGQARPSAFRIYSFTACREKAREQKRG